jgi:hypothetical protein
MVSQTPVTVVGKIRQGELENLKNVLASIRSEGGQSAILPFDRFSRTHFARIVIVDPTSYLRGQPLAANLVYVSDVDGSVDEHLEQIVALGADGLDRIFSYCEDYPTRAELTRETRLRYVRGHLTQTPAVYIHKRGHTVDQIRREARLREAIEEFLDRSAERFARARPTEIRAAIQAYVDADEALRWATRTPPESPSLSFRLGEALDLARVALLLLVLSPVIIVGFPIWVVLLRLRELTESLPDVKPTDAHLAAVLATEDHGVQNAYTGVAFVKPGRFGQLTSRGILWITNLATRHYYNRGDLGGVPIIHFLRFIFIDDYRRAFFISTYDGSLESYVDDLIDLVLWGLNAIFGQGVGYPKTSWLFFEGARDEQAFKDFMRVQQVPTSVFYSAYPQLSTANIVNNSRIRAGLYGSMSEAETARWLQLL